MDESLNAVVLQYCSETLASSRPAPFSPSLLLEIEYERP